MAYSFEPIEKSNKQENTMSNLITGSCLCGQVTYECEGEPEFTGNCHCRDCQKATGSAYTPELFFKETAVRVSGDPRIYERKGDSGKSVWRHFCPNCGTWVCTQVEMLPGIIGVLAGTLDDTNRYQPQIDIFTDSATCWDVMNPSLPKYGQMPQQA
jgi:hypothetical protein